MCKTKVEPLEGPLGTAICAYYGGMTYKLLQLMQDILDAIPNKKRAKGIPPRQKPTGIDLVVLSKEQTPPPGSVLLQPVEGARDVSKFTPKVSIVGGVSVIEIPMNSPAVKPKRQRATAGTIYAMVHRGNKWRDRSGHVHDNPL